MFILYNNKNLAIAPKLIWGQWGAGNLRTLFEGALVKICEPLYLSNCIYPTLTFWSCYSSYCAGIKGKKIKFDLFCKEL